MANTSDIKNGLCIEFNGNLFFVTEFQHVKPGKGPAFVRTKLKNVVTGKVIDNTFPSGHKIVTAELKKGDINICIMIVLVIILWIIHLLNKS